jgi:hypothetical protein
MLRSLWLLVVLVSLAVPSALFAKPAHKQALATHLGPFLSAKLNACTLCHLPDNPKDDGEKPHNPFGARLKAVAAELKKAGKPADILSRFDAIADEDSDGDGVPNIIEILTGHNPGDPNDKPSSEEVTKGRRILADYHKFRSAYPWRPFEPVTRPPLPEVKNVAWVRNPIDRFIAAEHDARGLTPRPEADKAMLLRRVYFDLTGLPPAPDELHAFLNDESPDAYEKVVDRLLASPRYGERWGRHWMDVWRYSDWAGWEGGGQIRDSQPHIWRWRDWIIESLNEDKGYDQMLREMLAADELAPNDPAALRATGFLVRNYKMLSREKWLQDTVDHAFLAFQAVTVGCAKCHDHMYDPISQKEYYQIRAIFTPHQVRIDRIPGEPDSKKDGLARAFDADLTTPTFLLIRGDDRTPDKAPLPPGVPAVLGGSFNPESVKLPLAAYSPDRRDFVRDEELLATAATVEKARTARDTALRFALASSIPVPGNFSWLFTSPSALRSADALALAKLDLSLAEAKNTAMLAMIRAERLEDAGKKDSPEWKQAATDALTAQRQATKRQAERDVLIAEQLGRDAVATVQVSAAETKRKAAVVALTKADADLKLPPSTAFSPRPVKTYPATSTGRRSGFAHWLTERQNPLTARVAVNHIWLRHFGQALVPSVFDFGRNGRPPSDPALVDWLACEFGDFGMNSNPKSEIRNPKSGWSMKHLHRLIVTSATYRQASTFDPASAAVDRDNVYLWRMPERRLEAEVVRDNALFVAGRLDLRHSGPDIDYHLGMTVFRRSLYFRHAAEKEMEFLKLFDAASVTECYQRKDSIIPQQALALFNSELTIRTARLLARDMAAVYPEPTAFVTAAFERTLTRPPTPAEREECLAFLESQRAVHSLTVAAGPANRSTDADGRHAAPDPALRARENLVQVLLNHHEFVTVR